MKAVVVYESMYGNTHMIADAIARGIESADRFDSVVVESVTHADPRTLADADLVVVGGPTHAHGMTRLGTRKAAGETAAKPGATVQLEPDAGAMGVRDWLDSLGAVEAKGAAFDTRIDAPPVLTGRASKSIAKQLRAHHLALVAEPQSFLVRKDSHLVDGEVERAQQWGQQLASSTSPAH